MKKLVLAVLALVLVPTVVFALDFHVDMPHIIAAPNFYYGQEYPNTTIGGVVNAAAQIYAQSKDYQQQLMATTDELQRQADENSKKLAKAVENNALDKVEQRLRKEALAAGDTVDVKSDSGQWELTYTTIFPSKAKRIDVATVYYGYSTCRIVTKVVPYGVTVFGVAQFKKSK